MEEDWPRHIDECKKVKEMIEDIEKRGNVLSGPQMKRGLGGLSLLEIMEEKRRADEEQDIQGYIETSSTTSSAEEPPSKRGPGVAEVVIPEKIPINPDDLTPQGKEKQFQQTQTVLKRIADFLFVPKRTITEKEKGYAKLFADNFGEAFDAESKKMNPGQKDTYLTDPHIYQEDQSLFDDKDIKGYILNIQESMSEMAKLVNLKMDAKKFYVVHVQLSLLHSQDKIPSTWMLRKVLNINSAITESLEDAMDMSITDTDSLRIYFRHLSEISDICKSYYPALVDYFNELSELMTEEQETRKYEKGEMQDRTEILWKVTNDILAIGKTLKTRSNDFTAFVNNRRGTTKRILKGIFWLAGEVLSWGIYFIYRIIKVTNFLVVPITNYLYNYYQIAIRSTYKTDVSTNNIFVDPLTRVGIRLHDDAYNQILGNIPAVEAYNASSQVYNETTGETYAQTLWPVIHSGLSSSVYYVSQYTSLLTRTAYAMTRVAQNYIFDTSTGWMSALFEYFGGKGATSYFFGPLGTAGLTFLTGIGLTAGGYFLLLKIMQSNSTAFWARTFRFFTKVRLTAVPTEFFKEIDDYNFSNGLKQDMESMVRIYKGMDNLLKNEEKKTKKKKK
jgi:hypothetical protein